jgi:predicted acylesterase/phospholipase RssA
MYDLVFEGGGAKGMAFVGALHEFEARGLTFDRLLGTSTGAITATLLAAGYRSQQMLAALDERVNGRPVFAGFMATPHTVDDEAAADGPLRRLLHSFDLPWIPLSIQDVWRDQIAESVMQQPLVHHLLSLEERGGWFAADGFLDWLAQKLDNAPLADPARPFSEMNLLQFHEATRREVSMVASDTTAQRMLVLNHCTAPECPLLWAVRMSMSLPLVWQEVEWQAAWGTYRGEEISGHIVVDGGLLSNFPIELLISDMPYITEVMGPKEDSAVLGFLIDESLTVPGAPPPAPWPAGVAIETWTDFHFESLRTFQRINRLIDTATKAHDKMVMESLERLVVRLPAKSYSVTEFDMSETRKDALIRAARQATRTYLDRHAHPPTPPELAGTKVKTTGHTVDHVATRILEAG